ncbi:MAG: hypothetical protein DME04_16055 [Candidatus Rokuibacteriota bacterium]|nr:MAG: hypothetical protein DME04_16055 [Candidatus Rokubacteria bacterium]
MSVRSSTPATRLVAGVLCLLGAVLGPRTVSAVTIDFSLAGSGNLGVGTYTNGPVTADAFYESNGIFISTGVTLVVQNAADLHGFGVCSPQESGCASGGIQSELDNLGPSELVRLTLAPGWRWVDVSISALTTVILPDRGQLLFANGDALPGDLSFTTLLTGFSALNGTEQTLAVSGDAANAPFLYLIPGPLITTNNDDFLVWKVTVEQGQAVPEPAIALLLGVALAALSVLARNRARRK